MATHHPSPPAGMQLHHGPPGGPPQPGMAPQQQQWPASQQMAAMNEAVWLQIGRDLGTGYAAWTDII
jgi:glucose repression mediator protein